MKIGFIPIDNRPVCYTLPKQIADIDKNIDFFMPEREWLGDLTKYSNVENIFQWLQNLPQMDAIIVSLDTIAYGGLISSRRCEDSFEEIKARIENFKQILKSKNAKIYAFSSIMRISNNNINEEEKEYWSQWGKKIFDYSFQTHKTGCENCAKHGIPQEVLDDYLVTRKRNFEINKIYLEWQKEGLFDTLVYSKDDCAEYGFNVEEAKILETMGAFVKTGADEIPLTLLARAVVGDKRLKIAPIFSEPDCKNLISNYEDVSIEESVKGQIELAGCEFVDGTEARDADLILYVNNFAERQGEIVMGVPACLYGHEWLDPNKPYMIADVRLANGADNNFVEQLLRTGFGDNFYGYGGWNTSANTLGSVICATITKYLAKDYNHNAFKKLQLVRFLDDWAYQANVRQELNMPDTALVKELMKDYESKLFDIFNVHGKIDYSFPWDRRFEIEVTVTE